MTISELNAHKELSGLLKNLYCMDEADKKRPAWISSVKIFEQALIQIENGTMNPDILDRLSSMIQETQKNLKKIGFFEKN